MSHTHRHYPEHIAIAPSEEQGFMFELSLTAFSAADGNAQPHVHTILLDTADAQLLRDALNAEATDQGLPAGMFEAHLPHGGRLLLHLDEVGGVGIDASHGWVAQRGNHVQQPITEDSARALREAWICHIKASNEERT